MTKAKSTSCTASYSVSHIITHFQADAPEATRNLKISKTWADGSFTISCGSYFNCITQRRTRLHFLYGVHFSFEEADKTSKLLYLNVISRQKVKRCYRLKLCIICSNHQFKGGVQHFWSQATCLACSLYAELS